MNKVAAKEVSGFRENFAENLRLECGKFRSIAHVCRALELNRQQFNRYLSGEHLPRPQIRRRMCELFGVPEPEMFMSPSEREAKESQISIPQSLLRPEFLDELAKLSANHGPKIDDGFYFLYFALKTDRKMLVRSILKIRTTAGTKLAIWHTFFRSAQFPARYLKRGRYSGVLISGFSELTLLTSDTREASALGMINLRKDGELYCGAGFVPGVSESYLSRVCLEFLGTRPSDLKDRVYLVGVASASNASVPPGVQATMAVLL